MRPPIKKKQLILQSAPLPLGPPPPQKKKPSVVGGGTGTRGVGGLVELGCSVPTPFNGEVRLALCLLECSLPAPASPKPLSPDF